MNEIFILTFVALAVLASVTDAARATYYNASFDCGSGQTVWIGNPVVGHGAERKRIVIFEIRISDFDFTKGPIRSPVVQWDPARPAKLIS